MMKEQEELKDLAAGLTETLKPHIEYWIEIFKKAIAEKENMRPFWEDDIHPEIHQAELDGMKAKLKELEEALINKQ